MKSDDPELEGLEKSIRESVWKRARHDLATEQLQPTIEDIEITQHGKEYSALVQWTRDDCLPDMPPDRAWYTITLLEDGNLDIEGPEW